MAIGEDNTERTQEPTAQHLAQARRRGEVARSTDLTAALTMTAALLAIGLAGGPLMNEMTKMTARMLDFPLTSPARADAGVLLGAAGGVLALAAGLAVAVVVVAIGANLMQTGLLAVGQLVSPDLARVSPGAGLARMFSARAAVRALAALVRVNWRGASSAPSGGRAWECRWPCWAWACWTGSTSGGSSAATTA
ncbi:MAG: EscU/YscU/HrcU family type III secretion system export apparatus switch protein [Planctomycetota bacterium]|nr:EscU/YscU/HrcU family type III secretion system export apparatus switch protein [Planctomycetota bacterium]